MATERPARTPPAGAGARWGAPLPAGVLIAGGGLAAQRCCETLRARGYEGRIRIACEEEHPPYDRPPLSKEFLLGEADETDLGLRPPDWYRTMDVELLLGEPATGLDPGRRELDLSDGRRLAYDRLLIATGSAPRRLPAAEGFENVHYLRTLGDARALREALARAGRIVVIGAGFIGQEVAASARSAGSEVTMIEALEAPLAQVLGGGLGRWFAELHAGEGVEVLLGATVERFAGRGRVEGLILADGRRVSCDSVVVGIGVAPALAWLRGTELPTDGIPVDVAGRSALPGIYAAGDSARPFDQRLRTHVRSEHWEAAARGGIAAARAMLGLPSAPAAPASFWSDQYGIRIQFVGQAHGADRIVIEGDPEARDFMAVFSSAGMPVAALLVGRRHALPGIRGRLAQASAATSPDVELEAA